MHSFPDQPRIHLHSRLWPALAIVMLVLQLLWPHKTWTALLGVLGGGWLIAYIWARSLARNLYAEREMRYGWTQVGDRLQERFTLTNLSFASAIWVEVQDHSTLPGYSASRVTAVGPEEVTQWSTEGACTRRGLYTLGPTSLLTSDPLGLYTVEMGIPDTADLLVLPPVLNLPTIEVASGGRAGEGTRHRRAALETTVSVQTVREYIPGDPLKAIHWPTSARRDGLFVRQFEQMPASDWWIFLDLQESVQAGAEERSTQEHGIILAASLADRGLRQGHAVGLVVYGRELVWIEPQRDPGQLMKILRALALVETGRRPLEQLLLQARRSIRNGASLIVITPNMNADWVSPLFGLTRNGITPTALLLDPASFGGTQPSRPMVDLLQSHNLTFTLVTADLLDQPDAQPGAEGHWEWRIDGRGKAIPVRKPVQVEWRRLR